MLSKKNMTFSKTTVFELVDLSVKYVGSYRDITEPRKIWSFGNLQLMSNETQ
jgi:hypothetical protein